MKNPFAVQNEQAIRIVALESSVASLRDDLEALRALLPPPKPKPTLYCSFCGKSQHEVSKLIAGPAVFICDECARLCIDIVEEEKGAKKA